MKLQAIHKRFEELSAKTLASGRVQEMARFVQHGDTSTLDHTTAVARLALTMARGLRLRIDEASLVRGAILHDYFLYDWHDHEHAPDRWHGFKTASGTYAGTSAYLVKLEQSDDVRSGATGHSAVMTANSLAGIVANGTMTNGRLNAGSMSATSTANHAEMDMANGTDDFYMPLYAKPDKFNVWLKYTQGTANANNKASVSVTSSAPFRRRWVPRLSLCSQKPIHRPMPTTGWGSQAGSPKSMSSIHPASSEASCQWAARISTILSIR